MTTSMTPLNPVGEVGLMLEPKPCYLGNNRRCLIMRGIPGSGKSYFLQKYCANYSVVSADHFFTAPDGSYNFDPARLGEAHEQCLLRFVDLLTNPPACSDENLIAVDNTNLSAQEISPYYKLAKAHGFNVLICYLVVNTEVAVKRNVHGVNRVVVESMANRVGELPSLQMRQVIVTPDMLDVDPFPSAWLREFI